MLTWIGSWATLLFLAAFAAVLVVSLFSALIRLVSGWALRIDERVKLQKEANERLDETLATLVGLCETISHIENAMCDRRACGSAAEVDSGEPERPESP